MSQNVDETNTHSSFIKKVLTQKQLKCLSNTKIDDLFKIYAIYNQLYNQYNQNLQD